MKLKFQAEILAELLLVEILAVLLVEILAELREALLVEILLAEADFLLV